MSGSVAVANVGMKNRPADLFGSSVEANVGMKPRPSDLLGSVALAGDIQVAVPIYMRVWSGSAWVNHPLRRWDGTAWVYPRSVKYWDGSAWQTPA